MEVKKAASAISRWAAIIFFGLIASGALIKGNLGVAGTSTVLGGMLIVMPELREKGVKNVSWLIFALTGAAFIFFTYIEGSNL